MAGIVKRGQKWNATWRKDGQTREKCTGISIGRTKAEQERAKNEARMVAQQMEAADKGLTSFDEAVKNLETIFKINGYIKPAPSVAELLADVPETGNPRSCVNRRRAFSKFTEWLGERVNRPITEITNEDCRSFVRDKLREISRGTVEQYRTYLFAAFKYAKVEKQILTHNPWEAVSVVKVMRQAGIEDSRLERLPFTKEELEIIFTKMPRPWRDLALTSFCLFGTRLGDCCRLRWQDVNWDAHRIRFVEQKTGTMRELPLCDRLYLVFHGIWEERKEDSPYIFPEFARRELAYSSSYTSTEFTQQLRGLGIIKEEDMVKLRGRKKQQSRKTFHSIRHSVITITNEAEGITQMMAMKATGHKDSKVDEGYYHLSPEAQQRILNALTSHLPQTPEPHTYADLPLPPLAG